jgi:hypothetical protein
MKECEPELNLWTWLAEDSNAHYLDVIEATGCPPAWNVGYDIKAITNLGDMEHKFLRWISANRRTCRKSQYDQPQYKGDLFQHMNSLPTQIGFNRLNTTDYSWGVFDIHNKELKDMLGGHEAFRKMGVSYDHALVRLLVQMPGHFQPWHFDTMSSWAETFPQLNPYTVSETELVARIAAGESRADMADLHTCDEGKIVRRLVCASEWDRGHMLELENSYFPNWNSGDVFDIPACLWHLSANAGINLKMTVIVTGVEQ